MSRKLLFSAICAGLFAASGVAFAQGTAAAQPQNQASPPPKGQTTAKQKKKREETLQTIVVTGSLIPTAEIETATPVIKITAQNIKQQGFTNIYQALRAQPLATGQVQGEQSTTFAGFTSGARTISLLGLPPDFTLTLIDGHPLTDYPLLYNGQISFQNIGSIPIGMISQIQIVPGNQSSLYGSAAIAGVINIILKKHQQGIDLNYQAGGFSNGGGDTQRLQLVGGYDHGKFSSVYGLQYEQQQPIWAFQRSITASSFSNPDPDLRGVPFFTTGVINAVTGQFTDPDTLTPNGCNAIHNQFGNTTVRYAVPAPTGTNPFSFAPTGGYACGSPYANGYSTLLNKTKSASGYWSGQYQINDNTQLYGSLLYTYQSSMNGLIPGFDFYEANLAGGATIFNQNDGQFEIPVYTFAPEDTGNIFALQTTDIDREFNFWGGVKGDLGQTDWTYDGFYARSQDNLVINEQQALTDRINAFFQNQFLGPQLGTTSGVPIYKPNYANLFQNITPAQYQSFTGIDHSSQETYDQNLNLQVTNQDLFELPAGAAGFAGVLQYGDQSWTLPPNPQVLNGEFYDFTASSGGGKRDYYATAFEFRVPIFKMLTADVSARYDHFANDGGGSNSKPTYKVSFAFRPLDTLLLRANWATAFRMPDMGESFIGPSGFFTTLTDPYQCELLHPGTPFSECSSINSNIINPQIEGTDVGNTDLHPITAKSWGGGVVWSPTSNFDIKADYYDDRIANEVEFQIPQTLVTQDSQCLLGQIPPSSSVCQAAEAAVVRDPANAPIPYLLTGVTVMPVNIGRERVSGIIASLNYKLDAGRFGSFDFSAQYNDTLHHTLQQAAGDPVLHLLHDPFDDFESGQGGSAVGPEFKSVVKGTVAWDIGDWASALTAIRYGKLPNRAVFENPTEYSSFGAGLLPAWVLYNATVQYRISPDFTITGTVNNLFDEMPPRDPTFTDWPYYDVGAYNPYGRSYFIDMDLHL